MRKALLIAAITPLFLTACESTPNPYPNGPGFYETRIEENRYRVVYRTPRGMPRERAEDMSLLRAAELTLANGYDWFRIVNRQAQIDGAGGGPTISLGAGNTNFGRRSAVGVGVGTSFNLGGAPAQTLTLEVQMGRGERPDDRAVYQAADVVESIRARL